MRYMILIYGKEADWADVSPERIGEIIPQLDARTPQVDIAATIAFIDRTFLLWAAVGLAIPFGLGIALGGTIGAGLTALLWGGGVRVFVVHHLTYSINSLCHVFGRRPFETGDHSSNLAWLALPTLGEGWHNNHHAFPRAAFHGMGWRQPDLTALVIRLLERAGLVWNVQRPSPASVERRRTVLA